MTTSHKGFARAECAHPHCDEVLELVIPEWTPLEDLKEAVDDATADHGWVVGLCPAHAIAQLGQLREEYLSEIRNTQ